jgi:arsenate reductase-like glutaredoxin family protein
MRLQFEALPHLGDKEREAVETMIAGVLHMHEIMRAFVQVRSMAATHQDLAKQLAELQDKTESLAMSHETFSRNTRAQLKQVFDALRELMTPPEPSKRPIGFVHPQDATKPKTKAVKLAKKTAAVKTTRKK